MQHHLAFFIADGTAAAAAASSALEGSGEDEDEENLPPKRKRKRLKHPDKLTPDKDQLNTTSSVDTHHSQPPNQHSISLQGAPQPQTVSASHLQLPHPKQEEQLQVMTELEAEEAEATGSEKPEIYILTDAERLQRPLSVQDSIFLWRRSEEMVRLGALQRARLGKGGPTRAWLSKVGDLLGSHELVRVGMWGRHWRWAGEGAAVMKTGQRVIGG
jgi:hypothetical protein